MYHALDGSEVAFTYAFPLPFHLPVPDGFAWDATFANWQFCPCQGQAVDEPVVTATVQRLDVPTAQLLPGDTAKAVKAFYGHNLETYVTISNLEVPYARSYVSMETPPFLLTTDSHDCATASREDALHFWLGRSVPALNTMIRAMGTVTQDHSLVEVDHRDLGHLVIQGARMEDNSWMPMGPLFWNFETRGPREPMESQWAFGLEIRFFHWANDYPFVKARLFRQKAENDRFVRGDQLSAIVSLNTAAEVMLFDAYRLILIDQGAQTEQEVTDQARAMNFSALVKTTLPQLLGGNWQGPAVTAFCDELYEKRNSAVHAGVIPAENDVLAAAQAFDGLKTFLEGRLMAKWKAFPRTLMCILGEDLRGDELATKPAFLTLQETVLADQFYWLTPDRRPTVDPSLRNRVRFP